jgi:hypothetical protein
VVVVDVQQATVDEQFEILRPIARGIALEALEGLPVGKGVIDLRTPVEREKTVAALEAERADYPKPAFGQKEVEELMTVTLLTNPESGWSELKKFLKGPVEHLNATIYEFQARDVLEAINDACGEEGTMIS